MSNPTITSESTITKSQVKHYGPKLITYGGIKASIVAEVRYDDDCGNGHNSFAITATINESGKPRSRGFMAGGCCHDEISEHFPELAPFIKWHLCSSDGPMHYVANTTHHASDRDCWGRAKGEPSTYEHAVQFGANPIKHKISAKFSRFLQEYWKGVAGDFDFEVLPIYHENHPGESYKFAPKYTFGGYADKWHECPFDTEPEALDFLAALQTCAPQFLQIATAWSEGKERDFDAARHCAAWPEATDEELSLPKPQLTEKLEARLPALLAAFRKDVESLGLVW